MKIRALRTQKGITQKELAKILNITPAYLCELEKNKKTNPNINLIAKIANELNATIEEVLSEDGGERDAS